MRRTALRTIAAVLLGLLTQSAASGGPAEDQYELAARQYRQRQYRLAAVEFAEFLKKYPDDANAPYAQFFLAEALVQLGNFAAARPHFDAFHAAHADDRLGPRALFRRGEAAYLTGDFDAAREHLTAFHQKHPSNPLNAYALPYLGDLALQANRPAEAQTLYNTALREYPQTTPADECRFGLAKALHLQKRFDDAERIYTYLINKDGSPWIDDSLLQLGQLQFEREEYDAAEKTLRGLLIEHPKSDLLHFARYWLGLSLAAKENWQKSIDQLEIAAGVEAAHPLWPAAQFHWGESLRQGGRGEDAGLRFAAVLEQASDTSWAHKAAHGRLRIESERNAHQTVTELAEEFADKYPASPLGLDVRRMYGRAQLKLNELDAAIAILTNLVDELEQFRDATGEEHPELSRREVKSLLVASRYLLGLAYVGKQQYEEALAAVGTIEANGREQPELLAGLQSLRATALAGLGKAGEAIAPLEAYLRLQPHGPDANRSRAQLAMSYSQAGKLADARRVYEEYSKTYEDRQQFLEATHFVAEQAFAGGDKVWARELFTTLADEKNPADIRELGLSGKAWTELDLRAPVRSAETFQHLLREFPDSPLAPEAALARASALEQLQQGSEALATYTLVIEKYPDSKQLPTALFRAAILHDANGDKEKAAELLAQYVKENPQQANVDAALYRWAWVLADLEKSQESVAVFTRLHMDHPRSRYWSDATYRLAKQASKKGDYVRVAKLTEAIADVQPQADILAHALYLQGRTAAGQDRWEDVAKPMQQIVATFPKSSLKTSADYWIAESLYRQGQFEDARQRFDMLARETHGATEPWMAMIPLRRALLLAQQRKWAAAFAMAEPIAKSYPNFSQQHEVDLLLGRCLARQAKFTAAREAFQRAVDAPQAHRSETAAMAQWHIGETYFHQKDYQNAVRGYSRVELLYDYPRWQAAALLQAGKCYELLGQWKEAADSYAKVTGEFAETTFKEEASQRLKAVQQKIGAARDQAQPTGGAAALDARSPSRAGSR